MSTAQAAATTGGVTLGAFDAVVEQIARSLHEQGAGRVDVEHALRDVFSGIASPFRRTAYAARYAELRARALSVAAAARRPPTAARTAEDAGPSIS